MALPPTDFTVMLAEEPAPPEMYERLRREGCLSAKALGRKAEVVAVMTDIMARREDRAGSAGSLCGPSGVDEIAVKLQQCGYINGKGRRKNAGYGKEERGKRGWWKFWG